MRRKQASSLEGAYFAIVMPSELKNARSTYQRLVTKIFARLLGNIMKAYIDDMVVKSRMAEDHIADLETVFDVPRNYNMKLNPLKCAFEVSSSNFLGHIVS